MDDVPVLDGSRCAPARSKSSTSPGRLTLNHLENEVSPGDLGSLNYGWEKSEFHSAASPILKAAGPGHEDMGYDAFVDGSGTPPASTTRSPTTRSRGQVLIALHNSSLTGFPPIGASA